MLRVRGKSGGDAISAELERVLAEAEQACRDLGAVEERMAARGEWLDNRLQHPKWNDRAAQWAEDFNERERLCALVGSLARQADALWTQMGGQWGDPARDVWQMRRDHEPPVGLLPGEARPERRAPMKRGGYFE